MTRAEIERRLNQYAGGGMMTAAQVAQWLGVKAVWRVKDKYLRGLPRLGNRYYNADIAESMKEKEVV